MNQTYNNYLLPWEITELRCTRENLHGIVYATVYFKEDRYNYYLHKDSYIRAQPYFSIEGAMANCDRELLFNGYEFIDLDKAEKLRLLL